MSEPTPEQQQAILLNQQSLNQKADRIADMVERIFERMAQESFPDYFEQLNLRSSTQKYGLKGGYDYNYFFVGDEANTNLGASKVLISFNGINWSIALTEGWNMVNIPADFSYSVSGLADNAPVLFVQSNKKLV